MTGWEAFYAWWVEHDDLDLAKAFRFWLTEEFDISNLLHPEPSNLG